MRFFHLADLHLGFPIKDNEDNFDYYTSLEFVVKKAEEYKIDAVVIAGDVFDSRDPDAKIQALFAKFVRDLTARGISVLLITGNHEGAPYREKSIHLDVYNNLKLKDVYISKKPEVITIKGINFITLPYPFKANLFVKEEYRNKPLNEQLSLLHAKLLEAFSDVVSSVNKRDKNVVVAHIPVLEGQIGSERNLIRYADISSDLSFSIEELDKEFVLYYALGHLHKHQEIISKKYSHPFVYAGSLDRLDFGEEKDEKGFYFVEIDSKVTYEFIENPYARKFYTIEIFSDDSFLNIDREKVKTSITRFVIKGDLQDETLLTKYVDLVKKEAYSFAYVSDERASDLPIRDSVNLNFDPIEALIEYLDKSPSLEVKNRKDLLIEEAKAIFEEIENEA